MSAHEATEIETSLRAGLQALQLESDLQTQQRLCAFIGLLWKWNRTYNLTAVKQLPDMVPRHLLDSLSIAPHIRGQRVIDIGTGAGLPGIPLALWFPQREFHLLDSNGKKMRFLFEAKRCLALENVTLHHCRAQDLTDPVGFDCILSRALASAGDIVEAGAHLLARDGCFLAMKGEIGENELAGLSSHYTVARTVQLSVPGIDTQRQLLCIERSPSTADKMASV